MNTRLFRAELRRQAASPTTRWILAILLTMILLSFAGAWIDAKQSAGETQAVQATERSRWLNQDPKNPHSAAHYGQWLFKRASPLAVLDPGVDPYVGRMMRGEAHHYNDAIFRSAQDRSALAPPGIGTVAGILHLVVPLVAMLLGFSAFAVDRERGTLRLALGNGAVPGALLAARAGALMALLAGTVAIPVALLASFAALTLDSAGWEPLGRILLWTLAEIAQIAVYLAIALIASLVARTARGAIAASLLAWALFCVLIPRLVTAGIEVVSPTPSQERTLAGIEDELRRYNAGEGNAARQEALLRRYAVKSVKDLPVNVNGTLGHEREQHDYAVFDRGLGAFNAQLMRQDRLAGWAGVLSPMVAIQSVSQALAGTDYRHHVDFLTSAESYRRKLVDTMNLDLAAHPGEYRGDRALWKRVPPFVVRPSPLAQSLGDAAVPLAILGIWILGAGFAAVIVARKVKP